MKKIIPLVFLISQITGCTMGLWDSYPVKTPEYTSKTELTDNVVNSFQYQNLKLTSQQNQSEKDVNIPADGVGFEGEKYVYILTSGASDLLSLNQYSSDFPFVSLNSDDSIPLKLAKSASPHAVGMFEDNYVVKVNKPGFSLSPEEIKKLTTLGFILKDNTYLKTINIKGVFFKKSQLLTVTNIPSLLKRKYKVTFYTDNIKDKLNVYNLTTDIVFTPITATADIVMIPLGYAFLALIKE